MLKQLRLQTELKQRKAELATLTSQQGEHEKRAAALEVSLGEAVTADDIALVSSAVDALEAEQTEARTKEKADGVLAEIARIEGELAELEDRAAESTSGADSAGGEEKREVNGGNEMNRYQVRELLKTGEYYKRSEVKDFYEQLRNIRTITGEGLTVPEIVVNRIMDIMGDYTTLYPLVDKIRVMGKTRILIDTDTTPAIWIEQTVTIPTGEVGTITDVSFDGFKVGKLTFVDNCMLQDSIINLDDYVTKKLARAIALALDLAILKGTGSANKQPDGIIPQLSADHKVKVTDGKLINVVKNIGLIDTGADSVGEIVAVLHRQTYYNRLLQYSINTDASGNVVGKLPNLKSPDLLGLRVVFNSNMPENDVLFGDFSKYTLVERETITIDNSTHVKFAEDQTAFRGKGRYDGKPTNKNAFVLVTIGDETAGG